jgi:signal transduction histidine kinase
MKFKFGLPLLFILAYMYCHAGSNLKNNFEHKRYDYSFTLKQANDSLTSLKKQIGNFAKKSDYKNAIALSKKLLEKAIVISDSSHITNAYWRQGYYFKRLDQLDSSYFYIDKAYSINLKLKDSIGAGDRLLDMANIQKSLGDYNGGMITATEGLKYLEGSNEIESISGLYQNIAVCQKELGNPKEALRWSDKIFSLLNKQPAADISTENLYNIKTTRANILAALKDYGTSLKILDSIAANTQASNPSQFARAICNKGHYMWLENKNNPESESLQLDALRIRQELNTVPGLISSTMHLAEYYFETNKPLALDYAQKALANSKKTNNSVAILEALDLLLPLKKSLGQDVSEEAIFYSNVQNTLEKTKQAVRAIYAATKYDNDALEKKNLMLLAQVAIKEKQNILAISATIISLILIVFVVLYKNQQKKKEQLEMAYKTELRFSKKLHDELGNDIFYLMTQVQKEGQDIANPQKVIILEGLDSIYQRIRDISKEFTAIDTGDNFGKEFFSLLNSYSSTKTKLITKELPSNFWDNVSAEAKIEVYRVLQELLVNMKKHSNASLVAITCSKSSKQVVLKYVDNGVGFSLKGNYLGNGLKNVENRIKGIKGSIIFDSKPNEGVTATITFAI